MRCGVFYVYNGGGNIVRSIDILSKKEYNYEYEEGRIVCAAQADITLPGGIVIAKNIKQIIDLWFRS